MDDREVGLWRWFWTREPVAVRMTALFRWWGTYYLGDEVSFYSKGVFRGCLYSTHQPLINAMVKAMSDLQLETQLEQDVAPEHETPTD